MAALKHWGADVVLNGYSYVLETRGESPPHEREKLPVQEGESGEPFNLEFRNGAKGWGWPKFVAADIYESSTSAMLHRRHSWLPGARVDFLSPGTEPDGPVAFTEFWDGVEANRKLIAAADRIAYEVGPTLAITTHDLTGVISSAGRLGKPERYKPGGVECRIYIPVKGENVGDLFIVRTSPTFFSETTSTFRAEAMAVAVDTVGDYVLWIADPDASFAGEDKGQIRQSVALADPQLVGSYAGASYPVGDVSVEINDLIQQSKRMLVARPDGVYTFNNVSKSVPVVSLIDALDKDNGKYLADYNGATVVPTIIGLLLIDGIQWEPCGPISSNKDAREFRNHREYAFCSAGEYVYAGTYDGTDSFIWLGSARGDLEVSSGSGPIVWHGVIATVPGRQIAPGGMRTWTAGGVNRLFLGFTDRIGYITLQADFSPVANSTSGSIEFPEGALDVQGPAVMVEVHSVEYIGSNHAPMDVNNYWTVSFDAGNGWETPGSGNSGVYQKQAFDHEVAGRRIQMKLEYAATGDAELESFVVSGIPRPVHRWRHILRVRSDHYTRDNVRARLHRTPERMGAELRAMLDEGWKGYVQFGNESVFVEMTNFTEATLSAGGISRPSKYFELQLDEVL